MVEDFEAKNDQKLIWGSIKTVIFFNVSFFLQNGEKAFLFYFPGQAGPAREYYSKLGLFFPLNVWIS